MAKKRRPAKRGSVWHLSSEEATLAAMPRFNGHACGHGVHGDVKYNRTKAKRQFKRELDAGSLSFCLEAGYLSSDCRIVLSSAEKYGAKSRL